ncbi:MAG: M50 family metallopeptidase [Evtepia gabavorous]
MLVYIIVGILLFGLLIAVHEGGHFLTAKLLGVQVNEFAIGMGPALVSFQRGETQYSLRAFPIGGYCAMEGEDEENDNPRSFSNKSPWRKLIILAAGSVMNFIAGFVLVAILFGTAGSYVVPVVRDFMDGFSCAGAEGLQAGDRIVSVNGHRILSTPTCPPSSAPPPGRPWTWWWSGTGRRWSWMTSPPAPGLHRGRQTVKMYGIYFDVEEVTFPGLMKQSWNTCWYFARAVWSGLVMLVSGQVGLDDMSGPVGIVSYLGEAGSQGGSIVAGLENVCYIIALIAVNLAIMNLLPIPALDGGRIFLLLVGELWFLLSGRKLNPKYEAWLHGIFFALLILLMVVVTFSDIWKLVK